MKDTITIRCSCGGTFEEPAEGIWWRPISDNNAGEHWAHDIPGDLREQVEARLAERGEGMMPNAAPKAPFIGFVRRVTKAELEEM